MIDRPAGAVKAALTPLMKRVAMSSEPLFRADALLAGEKRLLEMIAKGQDLSMILEALCRLVEELCEGALASILLLDPDGQRLWLGAAPS